MAQGRLDREQRRLATEMYVPPVDENLYVKSLWNRHTYKTQLTTFDSQNGKTKQSNTWPSTFDSNNSKTKQPNPRPIKSKKHNSKVLRP